MSKKDEVHQIPKCFNENLIKSALTHYTEDPEVSIINFEASGSNEISLHFYSNIFRLHIKYCRKNGKEEEMFVILKIASENCDDYIQEQFNVESDVYLKVMPQIEQLLKGSSLKLIKLAPSLIYYCNNPTPVILLEDMLQQGYKSIDDRCQIDITASQILIQKLATFHATSFVLQQKYDLNYLEKNHFLFHNSADDCPKLESLLQKLKRLNGFHEIVSKLEGNMDLIFKKIKDIVEMKDKARCKVLLHGDLKFNNMLLLKGQYSVEDAIMVDFGFSNYHSPAFDIYDFIYRVPALEVIMDKARRRILIQAYLDQFCKTLQGLKVPRINEILIKVKSELMRCHVFQIWFLISYSRFHFELSKVLENEDVLEHDLDSQTSFEKDFLRTVLTDLLLNKG